MKTPAKPVLKSGGAEIGASGYTEAEAPVQPDGGVPQPRSRSNPGNYARSRLPKPKRKSR